MKHLRARKFTTAFSGTVLALLFAGAWLGTQTFELWSDSWEVVEEQPAPVTVRLPANYFRITMLRSEFHYLSTTSSSCPHLVPRGTKLERGKECTGLVRAFESARRPVEALQVLGSYVFFVVIGLILSAFLRREGMGRARWLRSQVAVFALLTVMAFSSKAILLLTPISALVLPVAVVPMMAAYFLGRRLSFGVALASALLAASLVNFDFQVLLVHLLTGVTSVLALGRRRRVRLLIKAGAMAAWVAVLSAAVTTLVFSGTFDIHDDLAEHIDPRYSVWLAALFSGLGSGICALVLTPIVGLMVGEISRGRLLDLQDLDHPLLRRLRERAPATWEHSRAMANLAEAAAHSIGGDALMVRVGAYYHDVGKTARPEYFIENQGEGVNPHDQLLPQESARAIFHHVTDGVRLLRQEGVPEDVIEFAFSHHGSSLLEFFWHKCKAEGHDEGLSEKEFRYPGHKPSTRETGILMLIDAVEAAARTVDQPDKSHFEELVQRIVFSKLSQGQLDACGLSLADLRVVSNTIVDTLVSMYHGRIKYPWQTDTSGVHPTGKEESEPQPEAEESTGKQPVAVAEGNGQPVANGELPADATPADTAAVEPPAEPSPGAPLVQVATEPATDSVPASPNAPNTSSASAVPPAPPLASPEPPVAPARVVIEPAPSVAKPADPAAPAAAPPKDGGPPPQSKEQTPDTYTGPAPTAPRTTVPGAGPGSPSKGGN